MGNVKVGSSSALVDDEDFEKVSQFNWFLTTAGYAIKNNPRNKQKRTRTFMHRFILDAPKDKEVDHINRNPLDNRKSNLRLCSRSENIINTSRKSNRSGFKGVTKDSKNTWTVRIWLEGKSVHVGCYKNKISAAKVYDELAKTYHGRFAALNFPEYQ